MTASRVREALRKNGWALHIAILFFTSLAGQTVDGLAFAPAARGCALVA